MKKRRLKKNKNAEKSSKHSSGTSKTARPAAKLKRAWKTLLRRDIKDTMMILDRAFKSAQQRPPAMKAYKPDPLLPFALERYDMINEWSEKQLRRFLEDPWMGEIPKTSGNMKEEAKRVIHEMLGEDQHDPKKPGYLARWRMWPHRRETQREDDEMADKKATAKKKGSDKVEPKVAKAKPKTKLEGSTKLRVIKGSKEPKNKKRAAVKKAIVGVMTVDAIVKKTKTTVPTLVAMVGKGFIETV